MTETSGYCFQCDLKIPQPCLSTVFEFMRFTTAAVVQKWLWIAEANGLSPLEYTTEKFIHESAWRTVHTKFFERCGDESCCTDFDVEHTLKVGAYVTAFELTELAVHEVFENIPGLYQAYYGEEE
jgi:hypothetical protein